MRTSTIGAALAASMLVLTACGGEEEAPIDPAVQSPAIGSPALDEVQDPAALEPAEDDPDADVVPGGDASDGAEADDSGDAVVTPVPDEAG